MSFYHFTKFGQVKWFLDISISLAGLGNFF